MPSDQGVLSEQEIQLLRRGNKTMPQPIFTDEQLMAFSQGEPVRDDRYAYWVRRLLKAGLREQQMEASNIQRFLKGTPTRAQVIHLVEHTMMEFYRGTMKGDFGSMMIAVATLMQALEDKGVLTREELNAAREKLGRPLSKDEQAEASGEEVKKDLAEGEMESALDAGVASMMNAGQEPPTPVPPQPEETPAS